MTRREFIARNLVAAAAVTVEPLTASASIIEPKKSPLNFPKNFIWGTATAAYQIEGAVNEDGRGPSVWDTFCKKKGVIWNGDTGDVACDHYHRYREDVAMMKRLGTQAYRFSIAWSRVLPTGRGVVNEKGIAFYDRLLDELLKAGITPVCTLFHWDFPEALFQKGGWLNRDVADWFADYAALMAARFSDRIQHWITQNEPQCFIGEGHLEGTHAPGLKLSFPCHRAVKSGQWRALQNRPLRGEGFISFWFFQARDFRGELERAAPDSEPFSSPVRWTSDFSYVPG